MRKVLFTLFVAFLITNAMGQATLPFSFDGGNPSGTTTGLTSSNLGSPDYSTSPKMKFSLTGSTLVLYISEAPGILSYKIKWNQSTNAARFPGTFELLESDDNITYTTVQTYNSTLGQPLPNGVVVDETISNLKATTRYLKWIYSAKTNGNIALGAINLAKSQATTPTINISKASISGFSYTLGNGPSSEQSFLVSGSDLTGSIAVNPPANYEISTQSGALFTPQSQITLNQSAGAVQETAIYVRLKAGLTVNTYNEDISISSNAASSKNVSLSGSVNQLSSTQITEWNFGNDLVNFPIYSGVPVNTSINIQGLTITAGSIATNMGQIEGYASSYNGQNYINRFKFNGAGWTGASNFDLLPPNNMPTQRYLSFDVLEECKITVIGITGSNTSERRLFVTDGSNLIGTMIFPAVTTSGTLTENVVNYYGPAKTLYVFTNSSINLMSLKVEPLTSIPAINLSTSTLSGFNYILGNGPSAEQTFTLGGTNLTNNITVIAPTNYEISKFGGSNPFSSQLTFLHQNGTVADSTLYVRLKVGLSANTYNENITLEATGATSKSVSLSGSVDAAATPTINISKASISGFIYTLGNGPSSEQSLLLSGSGLTEGIVIYPPTNYEISTQSGALFTPQSQISLNQSAGAVQETAIYVRLKAGLSVNAYDESITISSAGAASKSVSLSGSVYILSPIKTIHVPTAGTLISLLSNDEKGIITHLTVTGNFSWAEIATIKQDIPTLSHLDLSGANVADNTIPGNQFINNSSLILEALILPSSLTSIGISAFRNCTGLKSVVIGNSVTSIGNSAFDGCSGLTGITIGNAVTSIGSIAFRNCTKLMEVVIPNSVTTINTSAFEGCSGLTGITIGNAVTSIGSSAFRNCAQLKEVVMPNSVTIINNGAFSGCSGITHLTLGSSVTTIGTAAFSNSVNVKSIVCLGNNPCTLVAGAFHFEILSTAYVIVPTSKLSVYKEHTGWGQFSNIFEPGITTSTTSINGLIYAPSAGPSEIKPFNVRGVMLTNDLTVAVPTNFEISTKTGSEFTPTNIITVSPVDGMVAETTFYVRLKADLSIGTYNESVTVSSTGFTTQNIVLNGAVRTTPETIHVTTAGTLSSLLSANEKATITKLTVTGNIDARDFVCMRDEMTVLADLNLKDANIVAYHGNFGTNETMLSYPENELPNCAFFNYFGSVSKTTLTAIVLPNSVNSLGHRAFYNCNSLKKIVCLTSIPPVVTDWGESLVGISATGKICVPIGTVPVYKSATGWYLFNIVEYKLMVSSQLATQVSQTSAKLNGSIDLIAASAVQEHGFIWNTIGGSAESESVINFGVADFESNFDATITDLSPGATYIARAFAVDDNGIIYGKESVFTTLMPDYELIVNVSSGGLVYSGAVLINNHSTFKGSHGSSLHFKFEPDSGYYITALFYNGNDVFSQISSNQFTATNLEGNCELSVTFSSAVKNILVEEAGSLNQRLSSREREIITDLTISGFIDSRDFKFMRDSMPILTMLDISAATINGYSGLHGTSIVNEEVIYPANEIPINSFSNNYIAAIPGKLSLNTILLPHNATSLGVGAFANCYELSSVLIGGSLSTIGEYAFTGCYKLESISIPASVTSIGSGAFAGCGFVGITLPEFLNYLGAEAFTGCRSLTAITIPSLITKIEQSTFAGCANLTNVVLSNSVNIIGGNAFVDCDGLLNIDFCNNVSEIGNYSFGNCDGLIHLDIPNSVTKIGNQAFDNCSSIESITIGEKLSVMGEFPFLGCFSLREFIVNSKNSDYSVVDGVLFNKNATILIQYPYSKQGNFIIPGTTNHIANYAFVLANGLANVTIPETVISIGTAAFFQCNNLESITVKSVSPINLSLVESVFDGVSKDGCVLYVPYGAKLAYENAIQWLDFTNIVELSLTETGKVDNRRIKIYPNPVRDELHLEYDGEAHFEIVSLVGQLIYKGSLVKTTIVKTSHLLPGVYLIRFTEGKAISTLKFVKE